MARGKYVVIEGHDGTGKSTQVALLREKLAEQSIDSVEMHEPGGIPIADELRNIVKNGSLPRDATTNLLLFTAARRELWNQLAEPALARGEWVVAARNWYSTLAYQGYGEGLSAAFIANITQEFTPAQYITPDYTFILTLDNHAERRRRISLRGDSEHLDNFEAKHEEFQTKVNEAYRTIAEKFSTVTILAERPQDLVLDDIVSYLDLSVDN